MAQIAPRFILFGLLALILSGPFLAGADDTAASSVRKTQDMMRDPGSRKQMLNTPAAKAADQQVDLITNDPRQKDAIYNLSADLFPNVATKGGNDPTEMTRQMENAMQNPEGFYSSWTPEQKANFQKIVHDLESAKAGSATQP